MMMMLLKNIRQPMKLSSIVNDLNKHSNPIIRNEVIKLFHPNQLLFHHLLIHDQIELKKNIMIHERVHYMKNEYELLNRIKPIHARKCFLFRHSLMKNMPLVYTFVAFLSKVPDNISYILSKEEGDGVLEDKSYIRNSAIFYSISSTQKCLQGELKLGKHLLSKSIKEIKKTNKDIIYFYTLSPIPGFRLWFNEYIINNENDMIQLWNSYCNNDNERTLLSSYVSWDIDNLHHIQIPLMKLCEYYLLKVKKSDDDMRPRDPVANFHMSNGAIFYRLNWMGDKSSNGMDNSYGIMVNYHYK